MTITSLKKVFPKYLEKIRKDKHLRVGEFYGKLGITRSQYYNLIWGKNTPSLLTVNRLSENLDIEPNEIFANLRKK